MPVQGDAKDKVLAYAEEHSPDLLIIGRSLGSRLKKVGCVCNEAWQDGALTF